MKTFKYKKSYIYEIKLPEALTVEVKNSATAWGEQYDKHFARVLREGLKRLTAIKERQKALEETEERLRYV